MTQAQAPSAGSRCTAPPSTTPTTSSAVITRGSPPSSWRSGPPNRAPLAAAIPKGPLRLAAVKTKGPPQLAAVKTKGLRGMGRQRCSWQRALWQLLDRPMWETPLPTYRVPSAKTQVSTTLVCLCIGQNTGQHHICLLVRLRTIRTAAQGSGPTPYALSPPPPLACLLLHMFMSFCLLTEACLVG